MEAIDGLLSLNGGINNSCRDEQLSSLLSGITEESSLLYLFVVKTVT